MSEPARPFFRQEIEVRFSETDAWGIVHHSRFFDWFEVARTFAFAARGLPHRTWLESDTRPMVVEVGCRYLAPLTVGDKIAVEVLIQEIRSRTMTFAYRVQLVDDAKLCATGFTKHLFADLQGRPRTIPREILDRIARAPCLPKRGALR